MNPLDPRVLSFHNDRDAGREVKNGAGTAFPASPNAGDLFFRTDLNATFRYDGGRSKWLGTDLERYYFYLDAGVAVATNLDAPGGLETRGGSTRMGYLLPNNATCVGWRYVTNDDGGAPSSVDIRGRDKGSAKFAASIGAEIDDADETLNVDFDAGAILTARLFAGTTTAAVVFEILMRRRG